MYEGQWRRFGVFIVNFEHISHLCSSVSIVDFEHVIVGWNINKVLNNILTDNRKIAPRGSFFKRVQNNIPFMVLIPFKYVASTFYTIARSSREKLVKMGPLPNFLVLIQRTSSNHRDDIMLVLRPKTKTDLRSIMA